MAKGTMILFFVYLVIGVYFLNYALNFVQIPEVISNLDKWIILAGGILILFGGIKSLLTKGKKEERLYTR